MAQDVYPVSPMGGFLIDSNGDKVNIADIMGTVTPISGWEVNPKNFPAYPLCVAGSDGKVYNLADLLKSAGGGGGGGSGGGVLVVHIGENVALDKTAQELIDAQANNIIFLSDGVINEDGITTYILSSISYSDDDLISGYKFFFYDSGGHATIAFVADDLTSYPVYLG